MQPLTFACPKCARRMGVGLDMAGRQVRCPHCRQVVVAPPAAVGKLAGSRPDLPALPLTPPEAGPASDDGDGPMPSFPRPPREGAESIFGESDHDDDSVFAAATARKPLLPEVPGPPDLGADRPPPGMIDFNAAEEEARQSLPPTDAIESGEVVRPILGPPTPFLKKDISIPDFELLPRMEKTPASPLPRPVNLSPPTPAQPFAFPPAAGRPEDTVNPWVKLPAAPPPAPTSGRKLAPPAPAPPRRGKLVGALLAYAVVATVLAAWGWLQSRPHPLSTIPDFFGQYRQTERKKVSALPVDANPPIPADLRVKLGQRLALGDLEFEPLTVEERKTKWEVPADGGRPRDIECLVLTARVRNVSKAASFHPLDPAFNRFATASSMPLSGVVVGRERFPGGPIPWPFPHAGREYVLGQEKDDDPLEPGQDRTTVIPAIDGEKGKKLMALVRAAKGTVLWQVHLRRGFVAYQGEDVSVAALVGVEFDAGQVKRLGG